MTPRPVFISAREAAERVPNGASVIAPGNNFRLAPETLLAALEARFLDSGAPRGLTLYYPMMVEAARAARGAAGTGFNRLAHRGLLQRVVGASFSRTPTHELNTAIRENGIEAYNVPMGTLASMLRATARAEEGVLTRVGLDTFVDPRHGGGKLNTCTGTDLAEVVQFRGSEYLFYPAPRIEVALLRASYADERGNISFEREAASLGALHAAMAARNSGGQVFVEVDAIVAAGSLDPKKIVIPGHLVTAVVRAEISCLPSDWDDADAIRSSEWRLTGERRAPEPRVALEVTPRTIIARRALRCVPDGAVVNLGAGLPMYDISECALWERATPDSYRFTIEQGPFGGWPEVGGVAANPDATLDLPLVFDYYTGGGIDVSILSFAEVDADGSVNVSRFGDLMPGCGGFIDITQNARNLVFCGTFSVGGKVQIVDGALKVVSRGKAAKFVPHLQQLAFNARSRRNRAESLTYITERAVFVRKEAGLVLTEIAPGIDVRRDVLDEIPFPVSVDDHLKPMDAELFHAPRSPSASLSKYHP